MVIDIMLLDDVEEPRPIAEKDVSGFTCRISSPSSLKICGDIEYVYSTAFAYCPIPLSSLSRYSFKDCRSFEFILENIFVTISVTPTVPSAFSFPAASAAPAIIEVRSKPVLWICNGYSESVSSSIF